MVGLDNSHYIWIDAFRKLQVVYDVVNLLLLEEFLLVGQHGKFLLEHVFFAGLVGQVLDLYLLNVKFMAHLIGESCKVLEALDGPHEP